MKIIAEQLGEVYLVQIAPEKGFILDADSEQRGFDFNLQSLIGHGAWTEPSITKLEERRLLAMAEKLQPFKSPSADEATVPEEKTMPLPDPNSYDTEEAWMHVCMRDMLENHPREQAIAACLETWRNRGKSIEQKADIAASDFSSKEEFMTSCLSMHDQETCDTMWEDHMGGSKFADRISGDSGAVKVEDKPKKGVNIREGRSRDDGVTPESHADKGAVSIRPWMK